MWRRIPVALLLYAIFVSVLPVLSSAQQGPSARKVLTRVNPQYPSMARNMNLRGVVRIEAVVAPNGTVKTAEVKGGHPLLGQAAQNAVREWKFEPAPHETREVIEVKFSPE
jgi:TonB family protein